MNCFPFFNSWSNDGDMNPELVPVDVDFGSTAPKSIEDVCRSGDFVRLHFLIENGADLDIREKGYTLLHLAAYSESPETVRMLIDAGLRVDAKDTEGCTPLCWAVHSKSQDVIGVLISQGSDVNHVSDGGFSSPLLNAIRGKSYDTVELLISSGCNVNLIAGGHTSPLSLALEEGHEAIVNLLISQGADTDIHWIKWESPLGRAARFESDYALKALLRGDSGSSIDSCSPSGFTALHMAAQRENIDAVYRLIACGANIHARNRNGETPLHRATFCGELSTMSLLVALGADFNARDNDGKRPVDWASNSMSDASKKKEKIDHYDTFPLSLQYMCQVRIHVMLVKESLGISN